MREIKFRAWDKGKKIMERVFSLFWYDGTLHIDIYGLGNREETAEFASRYEVMQYTGLKDKNGIEIYEGDIISWHKFYKKRQPFGICIVKYAGNYYCLGGWYENDYPDTYKYCEVIGNIYENPELLEGKEK